MAKASANSATASYSLDPKVVAKSSNLMFKAISQAPPPGTTNPVSKVLLTTQRESCKDLSISSHINSLAPLTIMEATVEFLKSLKKMKSLSPTASSYTVSQNPKYLGSNTSSPSGVAKVVTTLPPEALAIFLRSFLSTLLSPKTPASTKYLLATSSIPPVVMITLAPASIIFLHLYLRISHS